MLPGLKSWLIRFSHWLKRGEVGLMGALVVAAAFISPWAVTCSAQAFAISGGILQILGVLFALRGLLLIRVHFKKRPLRHLFWEWLKNFPSWKPRPIILNVDPAEMRCEAGNVRIEIWSSDKNDAPVEERVDAIVANLQRLRESVDQYHIEFDRLAADHKQQIDKLSKASKASEKNIRSDLETIHTADVIVSLVGLVWVMFGIALSSAPANLAALFGCSP